MYKILSVFIILTGLLFASYDTQKKAREIERHLNSVLQCLEKIDDHGSSIRRICLKKIDNEFIWIDRVSNRNGELGPLYYDLFNFYSDTRALLNASTNITFGNLLSPSKWASAYHRGKDIRPQLESIMESINYYKK